MNESEIKKIIEKEIQDVISRDPKLACTRTISAVEMCVIVATAFSRVRRKANNPLLNAVLDKVDSEINYEIFNIMFNEREDETNGNSGFNFRSEWNG